MKKGKDVSRPASHPYGACDAEIKAMVPEAIKDELAFMACASGVTTSEYLRDLVILHLRGSVSAARMAIRRGNATAGIGRETAD